MKNCKHGSSFFQWSQNDDIKILFDEVPMVGIRYVVPSMSPEEVASIKKYPFITKRTLKVHMLSHRTEKPYNFTIPKGYCYDGASIPRAFWRIVGANTDNSFLIPALVHDVLCEHHEYVDYNKQVSTDAFNCLLETAQVFPFKRFLMKHSVNVFQSFCGWNKKEKKCTDASTSELKN